MRRIVLVACTAVAASTLVGILLGAYLHEVGANSEPVRHVVNSPRTTISTTVSTVTVKVTPENAAQRNGQQPHRPARLVGDRLSGVDDAPAGGGGAATTTSDTPTATEAPTTTTVEPPPSTHRAQTSVPCEVGHSIHQPICVPPGLHNKPRS